MARADEQARMVTYVLLLGAGVAGIPSVYFLVGDPAQPPLLALAIGLLSMGLAWAAGCSLERRRMRTVRAFCLLAIAQAALAFVPSIAQTMGAWRWLYVVAGVLAAVALARLARPQASS